MWKLIKNNRGSITVEMCFVMPIVIGTIMMLIFLLLKGLNEATALGMSQVFVYEYSDSKDSKIQEDGQSELDAGVLLDKVEGKLAVEDDYVSVSVKSHEGKELYAISTVWCKRESNLCTSRLRRWQLYGNVLRE